jgi:hypothetical protein
LSHEFNEDAQQGFMHDHGAGAEAIVDKLDGTEWRTEQRDLAFALGRVFRSCIKKPEDLRGSAVRLLMLCLLLCPDLMGAPSMAKIGRVFGITRSALSKTNLWLQSTFNLTYRPSKGIQARLNYRKAQLLAVKQGKHASQILKRRRRLKGKEKKDRRRGMQGGIG